MNDLLDDHSAHHQGGQDSFSALGKSRIKSIASSVYTVGIIYIIFIGLILLAALVFLGASFALPNNTPNNIASKIILLVALLVISLVIYIFYVLLQYGKKLSAYSQTNSQVDLQQALVQRKLYWTIMGILSIIGLIISLLRLA